MMTELERALTGDSAHAAPSHILEGLDDAIVHRRIPLAPHTIYQELWHIVFWLRNSLNWIAGIDTPYPANPADAFPGKADVTRESWNELCQRFEREVEQACAVTRDPSKLSQDVRCPAPPGSPTRTMTVLEQLESMAAHNAYHFGRIVLLRQLCGAWPPPSGGFTW
jgi:uncharacterized damage-inducible protein DinB